MKNIEWNKIRLLQNLSKEELDQTLLHLNAKTLNYKKGSVILHAGETTQCVGVVLTGSVTIESNDLWGNRTILELAEQYQFFAESYAFHPEEPLLVDVIANEDCTILFLELNELRNGDFTNEPWKAKIVTSLLGISTMKNMMLSSRSLHTSSKSIRNRVMSYLSSYSRKLGKQEFDIPFDRQQLADYLNVERSALSKELGKMHQEGILTTRKNHFQLLDRFS